MSNNKWFVIRAILVPFIVVIALVALPLLMTSCKPPQDPTSDFKSEGYSYTTYDKKPLTSEISGEIESESLQAATEVVSDPAYYPITDAERYEIERIVASEGGYCPYEFQALVAECILNGCVAENMRPLEIFERGDFWLTHDVEPTKTTKQAVSDVFDKGIFPTSEPVRYYYNPNYCKSEVHESMRYVLTNCDCRFFADWE